jgi:uncharacterized membrane protein
MPLSIENYITQIDLAGRKRQAFFAWSIVVVIAGFWVLLILSPPIARAFGFESFARSAYKFFSYLCHQMDARSFHIGENKLAVCTRCFGFYFGFLLGLIGFPLIRRLSEAEPFPRVWLFAAMIPMTVDWSLGFFRVWENTHLSRSLTGAILGAACGLFIVPAIVEITFLMNEKLESHRAQETV